MSFTYTKTFASPLRIRYRLDAAFAVPSFGDPRTLSQVIADTIPGPLQQFLQRIAAQPPPADNLAAAQVLFESGQLRSDILDTVGHTGSSLSVAPVWGMIVSVATEIEFTPSVNQVGNDRAYWDLYLVHTIDG